MQTARLLRPALALAAVLALGGCANEKNTGTPSGGPSQNPTPMIGEGGTPPAGAIVIGEYASLTGATATFGTSTNNAVKLAVDAANKTGGVNGHPLFLKVYNDEGKPDVTRTVIQKLTTQDSPTAVLGEVASTLSLTAAPVCQQASIPMISPASTNPEVTKIGKFIFRACFTDDVQGKAQAQFAFQKLKARKAAIFTDQSSDYSNGLTTVITDTFTKAGGQIAATQKYQQGALDFRAQLTQIKAANPDVLFVPGYYTDVGPIAKQAREVGLKCPLVGGDGWDSSKTIPGAGGPGGALEGCYFTDHYSVNSPAPTTKAFVSAYEAAYGGDKPDALAALGYDAAGALIDALKRAGNPADGQYASPAYRAKLRDAIAATKGFQGATGTITLGPDRNAVKPVTVLKIVGNDFQYETSVQP